MKESIFSNFLPEQASTIAGHIDAIYFALVGISIFFTVGVALAIIFLATRYRRRADDEVGHETHESMWLEVTWTAIPLGICLVIFVWGTLVYLQTRRVPPQSLEIAAVGKQWMWKFQHPNGRREINDLHIPRGRPVHIRVISQDVLHGLYFPAFRAKTDAVPYFYTSVAFEANRNGSYHIFCHQYCGKDHSVMTGKVYVMDPADYEKWVQTGFGVDGSSAVAGAAAPAVEPVLAAAGGAGAKPAAAAPGDKNSGVERGKQIFQTLACGSCHTPTNTPVAPTHYGVYGTEMELSDGRKVKVDDNYIRESILNPGAKLVKGYGPVMPSYQGRVSEEQILDLIAYLKTLK